MFKRILTAAIGLIAFFLILPANKFIFAAAVMVICLGAIFEIHHAVTKKTFLCVLGVILSAAMYSFMFFKGAVSFGIIISLIPVYLIVAVVMYGKEKVANVYMLGLLTVIYTYSFFSIYRIKAEFSTIEALLPFLFAWITDTGAYFAGITLGKHKLAPVLSPKKTIEGSVGGIVLCVVITLIYTWVLNRFFAHPIFGGNYLKISVIAVIASVISQIGDLAASAVKREFGVKDFGKILPGHGGVMDRFDSIALVAPFVVYALTVI